MLVFSGVPHREYGNPFLRTDSTGSTALLPGTRESIVLDLLGCMAPEDAGK
jgi:hypothetical protein